MADSRSRRIEISKLSASGKNVLAAPINFAATDAGAGDFSDLTAFLPRDAMHSAVLVIVRLSLCRTHLWTVPTWFDLRLWFLYHMAAP